jgi:hypothetical protein
VDDTSISENKKERRKFERQRTWFLEDPYETGVIQEGGGGSRYQPSPQILNKIKVEKK